MNNQSVSVVITTINSPSSSLEGWANLYKDKVIVIGDLKTPSDWSLDGASYFGPSSSALKKFGIENRLPFNHYSRKMLGYLNAIERGSAVIIDTDDDNLPYESHTFPDFEGDFETVVGNMRYFNPYRVFLDNNQHIWPRGLPLRDILGNPDYELEKQTHVVGVWQGLADGDTDVDAVYRLTSDAQVLFQLRNPIVLSGDILAPFNSQNTAFCRATFPLLYLPGYVSFRFTDILRGYVAQHVMKVKGFKLGYCSPSVFQDRNPHDYMVDFESELTMYTQTERINNTLQNIPQAHLSVLENLMECYRALLEIGVVDSRELNLLEAWKVDLEGLGF